MKNDNSKDGAYMEPKDVKSALNTHVRLKGSDADYLFTGYIFRKGKKGFLHQAELLDVKNGNSVVIADLKDVEENK